MYTINSPIVTKQSSIDTSFPDLSIEGASSALVEASWSRCQYEYGLDPGTRLLGNRYGEQEIITRRERIEEPLSSADPLIHEIRKVVRNADYTMLIADAEGAAVAEYCDSAMARDLKKRGITVGTLWDEPCVGTNGIGTALASKMAVTVNGAQHYLNSFHQFICSAAPLIDHRGVHYGAINVTGNATESQTEAVRVSQYVRRSAARLHTYVFRDFFRNNAMIAVTDSLFSEKHEMSRLLAIDEAGCVVGATNELLLCLGIESRQELIGKPISEIIGLDYDSLLSSEGRLHRLEEGNYGGRFVVTVPPRVRKPQNSRTNRIKVKASTPATDRMLGLDELAGTDRRTQKLVNVSRRMLGNGGIGEDIPILLQGETGTGKDTFAKALHQESRRAKGPFVEVNCAAIPESLIDSELFGYVPGTFTGGLKEGKAGHIIKANGGTLFLDEIGDMPLESQTRLLRVLSEHQVQPLGAAKPLDVDFQLVCASHRDLPSLVANGLFREDLYYRVCGAKLTLPPLRQRQDFMDIVLRLLRRFDPDQLVSLSDPVWEKLNACQWPGNIRQLYNVLQYLVFSCRDGLAMLDDLPDELDGSQAPAMRVRSDTVSAPIHGRPSSPLHQNQPQYCSPEEELTDALYKHRWSVTQTAKSMGISRATVHRHMKKYGIVRPGHQYA